LPFINQGIALFDNEDLFQNGNADHTWYHSLFTPNASHKVIGEATPVYMYWHNAPRRIWEYNSEMKLIVVLRNPIERAYSHWNMQYSRNKDPLPFWDAIQSEFSRCRSALPYQHRLYSYIDRGFYQEQLRRLWFYFSREQVLILKNEYLRSQPQNALSQVCNFLEIEPFEHIKEKDVHSLPYQSEMSVEARHYLSSIFEYEIRGLEQLLGWDCSDWLSD